MRQICLVGAGFIAGVHAEALRVIPSVRLAAALGIADRVEFTGLAKREAIPGLVAGFDIALQPAVVPYASPLKVFSTWRPAERSWPPTSPISARCWSTGEPRSCLT
jgi:hypothetical protein